jgi:hypothetical protein
MATDDVFLSNLRADDWATELSKHYVSMVIRKGAVSGLDSNVVKFEPALAGDWATRGGNYWGLPLHSAAPQSRKLSRRAGTLVGKYTPRNDHNRQTASKTSHKRKN